MPNVEYVLPELGDKLPLYDIISDCLAGGPAVKKRGTKYLPNPSTEEMAPENIARYDAYLVRAVFYNVAQRTLNGLVGQIFSREPNIKVPTLLDAVVADVDGAGVTLAQQAKQTAGQVLSKGRAGLYVDYPDTQGRPASIADVQQGNIRPTITMYRPEAVINWRTTARGAKQILSLVVLAEMAVIDDDGFEPKLGKQWRVLRLVENKFVVELYDEEHKDVPTRRYSPTDSKGNPLDEIPFLFVGVEKNDVTVDLPPMYDLCDLNIGHYRNSADFEEAAFICGQATPVITGLTEEWAKNVLGGKVTLGSRAAVMLPADADFKLVQAEETNIQLSAMEHKERQMVALGAKLVEQKTVQRTATEASQEEAAESSVLSATAKNVGAAYKWALEWACIFVGLSDPTNAQEGTKAAIEFDLNTEFDLVSLTPEERKTLLAEWQGGAITREEYRDNLVRAGIATLDYDEFEAAIAEEEAAALERMAKETIAQTPPEGAGGDDVPPGAE